MTTVELGRRPRWLLVAGGAVALWVLLAVVVGGGGGGGSSSTTTTTSTASTATSTTTAVVEGGPALAVPAGWELVVTGPRTEVRAIALGTGVARTLPFTIVRAVRPDGVFSVDAEGLLWRPYPMDDATAVRLSVEDGAVIDVPAADVVWVARLGSADLVSLDDGRTLRSVTFPPGVGAVGAGPSGLVLAGAGVTFVAGADGALRTIEGVPVFVTEDAAVVRRCTADAQGVGCASEAVSLADGAALGPVSDLPAQDLRTVAGRHPRGWPTLRLPGEPAVFAVLRPDGFVPVTPAGLPVGSGTLAWTPDGRLLLVRAADVVHVIDAFADGGPVEVSSFRLDRVAATMHVVGPG